MRVPTSLVSIVIRRVTAKSTVGRRGQTKVTKATGIRFTVCPVKIPKKNASMCIECETVEDYVPSGIKFLNTEEKKCGRDTIHKLDSEERESEDSVTVVNTGTEIISSSQACKDVSNCKHVQKAANSKKRPSLYWITVLLVMWCIAILEGLSIVTIHRSNEMKKAVMRS